MNAQTERAITDLQRLLKIAPQNYHPALNRAIDALCAGAADNQTAQQRIELLEKRERAEVTA